MFFSGSQTFRNSDLLKALLPNATSVPSWLGAQAEDFPLHFQAPQQKLFSSLGLTSGSLDVPLTEGTSSALNRLMCPRFALGNDTNAPEQIHLNYGSPTSVVVSWVTGE
jgi:hypothetical protein